MIQSAPEAERRETGLPASGALSVREAAFPGSVEPVNVVRQRVAGPPAVACHEQDHQLGPGGQIHEGQILRVLREPQAQQARLIVDQVVLFGAVPGKSLLRQRPGDRAGLGFGLRCGGGLREGTAQEHDHGGQKGKQFFHHDPPCPFKAHRQCDCFRRNHYALLSI